MEATMIAGFISLFGPALWKVFETLLEKGSDQLLEQGYAPFSEWIEGGYQTRKSEKAWASPKKIDTGLR